MYLHLYDICILYLLDNFHYLAVAKRHRDKEKTRLNLKRQFVTCYIQRRSDAALVSN